MDLENSFSRTGKSLGGFGDQLFATSNLARIGFVAIERLHIASLALENAQDRVALSQERLNRAIKEGDPAKITQAQRELEISTRSLEIAKNRLLIRELFAYGTVFPEMIRGIYSLTTAFRVHKTAVDAAQVSLDAFIGRQTLATAASRTGILGRLGGAVGGVGRVGGLALAGLGFAAAAAAASTVFNNYGDIKVEGTTDTDSFVKSVDQASRFRRGVP